MADFFGVPVFREDLPEDAVYYGDLAEGVGEMIAQAFTRNGWFTKFAAGIPVVGYIPSAIQAIAGNINEARRDAAKSTNSLLVTGGAMGGLIVGGPAGAVAGGAAGGALGTLVEGEIATTVNDDVKKIWAVSAPVISRQARFLAPSVEGSPPSRGGTGSVLEKQGVGDLERFALGQVGNGVFVAIPKAAIKDYDKQATIETDKHPNHPVPFALTAEAKQQVLAYTPVLKLGDYSINMTGGSGTATAIRKNELAINPSEDGGLRITVGGEKIQSWKLDVDQSLVWSDQSNASPHGAPFAAHLTFSDEGNEYKGWFQFAAAGAKIDVAGSYLYEKAIYDLYVAFLHASGLSKDERISAKASAARRLQILMLEQNVFEQGHAATQGFTPWGASYAWIKSTMIAMILRRPKPCRN